MFSTINRLDLLKVRDVMNRRVVTARVDQTMAEAGELLRTNRISGAPVVDEYGRVVGVITAVDFLPSHHQQRWPSNVVQELVQDYPGGPYHVEEHIDELVRDNMSTAVQTMDASTSLVAAARCLCLEHIHRVIVVDRQARPVGVLTSLDIVAALVNIVEEQQPTSR